MNNSKNVTLMHENIAVATLEMSGNDVLKVVEVLNDQHLPYGCADPTPKNFNTWIKGRRIKDGLDADGKEVLRDFLKDRRNYFKTKNNAAFDRPQNGNPQVMMSLTDHYFFKVKTDIRWDTHNFYEHEFDLTFGNVFFEPWLVQSGRISDLTPDLTTGGIAAKRWRREGEQTFLYKAGSQQTCQEPLSEVMAAITLGKIYAEKQDWRLPYVSYDFAFSGMTLCSKSANFTSLDQEFVSMQEVLYHDVIANNRSEDDIADTYEHIVLALKTMHVDETGIRSFLDRMLFLDVIIGNQDRHLNNFGILRNPNTLQFIRFAPLFDNGYAYYPYYRKKPVFTEEHKLAAVHKLLQKAEKPSDVDMLLPDDDLFRLATYYPDLSESCRDKMILYMQSLDTQIRSYIKEYAKVVPTKEPLVQNESMIFERGEIEPEHQESDQEHGPSNVDPREEQEDYIEDEIDALDYDSFDYDENPQNELSFDSIGFEY